MTGQGTIAGRLCRFPIRGFLVLWHTGYGADENDCRDVRALCDRFGIPLPDQNEDCLATLPERADPPGS